MGSTTGISWTDSTLNLAMGCTKVSEECRNCYMYRDAARYKTFDPYKVTLTKAGKDNEIMRSKIKKSGRRIFVNKSKP
jgi:protein gp37